MMSLLHTINLLQKASGSGYPCIFRDTEGREYEIEKIVSTIQINAAGEETLTVIQLKQVLPSDALKVTL